MTTQESNILIADFMGAITVDKDGNIKEDINKLRYNTCWDWLMPVVEKIESLFNEALIFAIHDSRAHIRADSQASLAYNIPDIPECYSGFLDSKIGAVYDTCIQFIQWYNQHSK